MLVVGIQRSSGDFNGIAYDNYKLHCLYPADEKKEQFGQLSEVIKVPKDMFEELKIDIGSEVVPFYDKYGRLIRIET